MEYLRSNNKIGDIINLEVALDFDYETEALYGKPIISLKIPQDYSISEDNS